MTLTRIVFKNARQRALSTVLTGLSVAVGVALIAAILIIKVVTQERLEVGYSGFDLVVGAKGSPLQLVLNVVYHLDTSPGNIPYSVFERLEKDTRVTLAVPFSVGDNYQGFRIVGTTDRFLKEFEPSQGRRFELAMGRIFEFEEADLLEAMKEALKRGRGGQEQEKGSEAEHEHGPAPEPGEGHEHGKVEEQHQEEAHHHAPHYEAVLGWRVAQQTGLQVGEKIVVTHGVQAAEDGPKHEESPWTVVGILKPTGTPADQAIYINLDSFYHVEGHELQGRSGTTTEARPSGGEKAAEPELGEISAIGLKGRNFPSLMALRKEIGRGETTQAAAPVDEIRKLLRIVGNVDSILLIEAALIVVVSAVGTALAMFNSMNDRRRDIAVMRALGARRQTIFGIVVGEAVLIAGVGGVVGLALGHLVVLLSSPLVEAAVGFPVSAGSFHPFELGILAGMLLVGIGSGLGPAAAAYRTNVAENLSPHA